MRGDENMDVKYVPKPVDKEWMRGMLAIIKDGGILAYPSTGLVYHVDHQDKSLMLVDESLSTASLDSYVVHQRTIAVLQAIGWKMR